MHRSSMPQSPDAPERMEGMVPGVNAGGFLFLSAIRGRDPKSNTMVEEPLEQARQALEHLLAHKSSGKIVLTVDDRR